MDTQHLTLTMHSTDGLGLQLAFNSEPNPGRFTLSASSPGAAALGVHSGQPRGSHRCLRIVALGPELSIWEGATERAALRDPTQAAHVPRSPTRVYPTPVDSGGVSATPRGCPDLSLASA